MQEPVRLLLVDSPTLHRRSLAALLNRRRGLRVVGEAANGPEAIVRVRALHPDVAIVEPKVPDGGSALVAGLCQEDAECLVLVLTSSSDDGEVRQVLQAGARGYLDKDREPDDLVRAIERIHAGDLVVSQSAADSALRELVGSPPPESRSGGLTTREIEVLRQVARGKTNPQIARELFITEHTVKAHLANIQGKLGLGNRVQLATYATQQRIAPSAEGVAPHLLVADRYPSIG
ncbi:MAG: LuxR C-terminal-related transcriptional regulator [Chloroflexota bacterium]